jgi:hypothetical protein
MFFSCEVVVFQKLYFPILGIVFKQAPHVCVCVCVIFAYWHCILFGKFTVYKKQKSTINTRKNTNLKGKGKKDKFLTLGFGCV